MVMEGARVRAMISVNMDVRVMESSVEMTIAQVRVGFVLRSVAFEYIYMIYTRDVIKFSSISEDRF